MPPLKLNLKPGAAASPPPQSETPATPSIKLSFKRPPAPAAADSATSPAPILQGSTSKKAPVKTASVATITSGSSKKRPLEDEESEAPQAKKKKPGRVLSLKTSGLASSGQGLTRTPTATPRVILKNKGKIAQRPLAVGYDSEAEDAEPDPAIEENFVLRMIDGPDCDYVRQAIKDKTVGVSVSQGGADISMRFFTRDARRACIGVRGRYYAATMVDLPCIVESMKSWDKKGWYKSADISQMLYVFRQVASEAEAKTCDLPREVDQRTWQWPDGLTPPMKNVRKRRFRKRANFKQIEKVEEEVDRLIALDELCKKQGGSVTWEVTEREALEEEESEDELLDDAGEYEDEEQDEEEEEETDEAIAARLAAQLGEDDSTMLEAPSDAPTPAATVEIQPSTELVNAAPTPVSQMLSPAEPQEQSGDDDEDDEDDSQDMPDEDDEEAREKAAFEAQQREEIAHIEREIAAAKKQQASRTTAILKARDGAKIKSLENDLQVKKRAIGLGDDE